MTARPRRRLWGAALCNVPFLIALTVVDHLPSFLDPLLVGSILFFAPGVAWIRRRDADDCERLVRVLGASFLAVLTCWAIVAAMPGPTSRTLFLIALATVMNTGWWLRRRRPSVDDQQPRSPLFVPLVCIAALFYCQSFIGAAYRIPVLEDQDMEVQGTAYALIHHGTPAMVTNRGTTHFFAHPVLLHFMIGMSAFITNDLDRLRFYHESAYEMRGQPYEALTARFKRDFSRFERDPMLLTTRTPNLWLGVFVIFPLAGIVYRTTRARAAALGVAVVYATLPEVYVRSAYGGYAAITNFLSMTMMYFYLRSARLFPGEELALSRTRGAVGRGVAAAFLAAWANQKAVMVCAAIGLHAAVVRLLDWSRWRRSGAGRWRPFAAATAIVTAFFVGWGSYALYGYTIAPQEFISDHIYIHFVDRLRLDTLHVVSVPPDGGKYPSILQLWQQFFEHMGWLITMPCVAGLIWSSRRIHQPEGVLLLWILVGGIGFSVVDWRQTKHLSQLLPAFVALGAIFWASRRRLTQVALGALVGGAVAYNLWRIAQTMIDFSYLRPYRMW